MAQTVSDEQLRPLHELATVLLDKKLRDSDTLIVPFIGAGASTRAGVPASEELKDRIYRKLVPREEDALAEFFDKEAVHLIGEKARPGIRKLSLFEFISVVSQYESGREAVHKVLSLVLREGTHHPLAYELLAHLTKHEFLDHFVCLNFDELLDEALKDEISDKRHTITGPEEVPGLESRSQHDQPVFLFKPFGSLSRSTYKLEPKEIQRYGSEGMWDFMLERAFHGKPGNRKPNVYLLLVGYAGAEPAFKELLKELRRDGIEVTLFIVELQKQLPDPLRHLDDPDDPDHILSPNHMHHIQLPADLALDLLLQIMEIKYRELGKHNVWIPVDRHKVISYCLEPYATRTSDHRGFIVELILQAVKSRDLFNVEAIADIPRIEKYSRHASRFIERMCNDGILEPQPW